MIELNDTLKITLLVLLIASYIIYNQKPSLMFHNDGTFKHFGLKKNETIIPFHIALFVISFITYFGLKIKGGKYI